ncbi:MAG: BTAD domain-containing putative transcriptional regulator [Chloroflexota bacterium]
MEGASVLIVDDDAEIRSLVSDFLESEGYRTATASSGREVIDLVSLGATLPDVLLLDLMMPDVDGWMVLDTLRKNLLQEFPVLIFSARRPDQSILGALDSELRDFVAKPFDLDELLIRLKRLLQRSPRFSNPDRGCLRVYSLGSLRVYLDDVPLFDEGWRNKPAKTIFKLLYTNRGKRHPKDVLSEEVWPETAPDAASNRLRVAVHELRKILGDRGRKGTGASYIGQQEGSYYFDPTALSWSDADCFQEFVNQGSKLKAAGDFDAALHAFQKAEALYQGDYLRDDLFCEWSVSTRERLREMHLTMLGEAATLHAEMGSPAEAASFCRKIVRIEPWREEVYRKLMEYLVAAGKPYEALRAYEDCRRALRAEMGAEPSPETTRLRDAVIAGNRGTEAAAGDPRSEAGR